MSSNGGKNDRLLMKLLVTILKFYSLGLLFSCLCTWLFNSRRVTIEFFKAPVFWLGPLFFILLSLAIGGLLLILGKPKNRIRFLIYATTTGFFLFCITIASFQFYHWYHLKYLANIEANEEFLNSSSSYPLQEKQAFKMLTDKSRNHYIMKILHEVECVDLELSKYELWEVNNPIRPDKAGNFKAINELVIDGGRKIEREIFRIKRYWKRIAHYFNTSV